MTQAQCIIQTSYPLGPGVTRHVFTNVQTRVTEFMDVCVSNESNGPLSFFRQREDNVVGAVPVKCKEITKAKKGKKKKKKK